jgi:predicted transcriptional regulator
MLTRNQLQNNISNSNLDDETKKHLCDMLSIIFDNRADVCNYVTDHLHVDEVILNLMPIGVPLFAKEISSHTDKSNQKIVAHLIKLVNKGIVKRDVIGKQLIQVETYDGFKAIESEIVVFTRLK